MSDDGGGSVQNCVPSFMDDPFIELLSMKAEFHESTTHICEDS